MHVLRSMFVERELENLEQWQQHCLVVLRVRNSPVPCKVADSIGELDTTDSQRFHSYGLSSVLCILALWQAVIYEAASGVKDLLNTPRG